MYALLPLLLIFFSFALIIFLIVKKFPQLTLLDVESIPEVKEEKKKDEFLKKRAEKKSKEVKEKKKEKWQPYVALSKNLQTGFRSFTGTIEKKVFHDTFSRSRTKKIQQGVTPEHEIKILLREAHHAWSEKNVDVAEKKYIEIIRLDPKHVEAYQGLAKVYSELGQDKEAEETYKFLHHLVPNDDSVIVSLAEIAEENGKNTEAIQYYEKSLLLNDSNASRFAKLSTLLEDENQYPPALEAIKQAVELEPQNPKYLDNLIELAIMVGNKELAEEGYGKLRLVNPQNHKLPLFKDKIQALE